MFIFTTHFSMYFLPDSSQRWAVLKSVGPSTCAILLAIDDYPWVAIVLVKFNGWEVFYSPWCWVSWHLWLSADLAQALPAHAALPAQAQQAQWQAQAQAQAQAGRIDVRKWRHRRLATMENSTSEFNDYQWWWSNFNENQVSNQNYIQGYQKSIRKRPMKRPWNNFFSKRSLYKCHHQIFCWEFHDLHDLGSADVSDEHGPLDLAFPGVPGMILNVPFLKSTSTVIPQELSQLRGDRFRENWRMQTYAKICSNLCEK